MTDFSDPDLAAIAEASQGRATGSETHPPALPSASLADVLAVAERARVAHERRGVTPPTDAQERYLRLKPVLEQLPVGMARAPRQELEGRIEPRLLRAVLGWA